MNVNRLSNQVVIGLIVVVVGILFLLNTMNIYNTGIFFRWIPSLLIILGLWRLVASGFRNVIGPVIVIAIGAFIQMLVLGIDIGALWPVILIILGLSMVLGRSRFRNFRRHGDIDMVNGLGIFGGPNISINSRSFKGGQVTALMGGVDLDLRQAEVDEKPAVVEATVIMGGAEIKVPEGWIVKDDTFAFFGGTDDKRSYSSPVLDGAPDLVITGLVFMGGLEIKD